MLTFSVNGIIEEPLQKFIIYIPSSAINIDMSVNTAFTADKMNAVKNYVDITDC